MIRQPTSMLHRDFLVQFIRTFLIAFLCTVAAIGHAPAWVHSATCDNCVTEVKSEASCCHHCQEIEISNQSCERQETPCDSGSCAICQSLTRPVGFGWEHSSPTVSDFVAERVSTFHATITYELWMAASHPLLSLHSVSSGVARAVGTT